MLKINVKELGKATKGDGSSGQVSSLSRFILPISAEQKVVEKIPLVGYSENISLYQYCDICRTEHPHYQVRNAKGTYATCTKCGHGYKIGL